MKLFEVGQKVSHSKVAAVMEVVGKQCMADLAT